MIFLSVFVFLLTAGALTGWMIDELEQNTTDDEDFPEIV